jgi:hypothetical protein
MSQPTLFKYRHFQAEIILLCVRWYLGYSLSYRDLEEMMSERGLSVDHTTIYRWVQHYAPLLEKRCRAKLKMINSSWRADETYIKVKGVMLQQLSGLPYAVPDKGKKLLELVGLPLIKPLLQHYPYCHALPKALQ